MANDYAITALQLKQAVDEAADRWMSERVIPYTEKYDNAYTHYKEVLKLQEEDTKKQIELFFIVLSVVGAAVLRWASSAVTAAALKEAKENAILGVATFLKASGVLRRIGMSRHQAYQKLKDFSFGPGWEWIASKVKGKASEALQRDIAPNSLAKIATPLVFRGHLEQTVLRVKSTLKDLIDGITDATTQAAVIGHIYGTSPFLREAPSIPGGSQRGKEMTEKGWNQLEREMTLSIWAAHILGLAHDVTVGNFPSEIAGAMMEQGMYESVRVQFNKVPRAPQVGRVIAVSQSGNLARAAARRIPGGSNAPSPGPMRAGSTFIRYADPGKRIIEDLGKLGVLVQIGQYEYEGIDKYVGWSVDLQERKILFEWAKQYLFTKEAQRTRTMGL